MDGEAPIVVEQTFNAPVAEVWKAIVDRDRMRRWFFETIRDFRPEIGFETQFNVHAEGQDYLHLWKVTEVDPGRSITYDWRYAGYQGDSSVTWDLSETSGGTTLTLTHQGIETFPKGDPLFSREACQEGWRYFIQQRLRTFLEQRDS